MLLAAALLMSTPLRAPSIPLVVHDPFFSVWCPADKLTDKWSVHWTGKNNALVGLIRVDGKTYRLCGPQPGNLPAVESGAPRVEATTTHVPFQAGAVKGELSFCSPLLIEDIKMLSQPVSYIRVSYESTDGKPHDVSVYWDASAEWCVNQTSEIVQGSRLRFGSMQVGRIGTTEQKVLGKKGDDDRINWGYLYLAGEGDLALAPLNESRELFAKEGRLVEDDIDAPRAANDGWPGVAVLKHEGKQTKGLVDTAIGYDDILSIEYLGRRLPAYWRKDGESFGEMFRTAFKDRDAVLKKALAFDAQLRKETTDKRGAKFADIAMLAYRQGIGAQKIVADLDGTPLMFSKENFSNGCIVTVDVTYPAAPLYLWKNPKLASAMLLPILQYASLPRWKFDFAPHDLGTYPIANGQVYGGGERTEENQMPVEECGNMVILAAAVARHPEEAKAMKPFWPLLKKWTDYLVKYGLDPAEQLCTDDFAGHLARNANLSLKAIMGIGAAAQLAKQYGDTAAATEYAAVAKKYAAAWRKLAGTGEATVLNFGNAGSWSLKYNLIWDELLGLNLFGPELPAKEIGFYLGKVQPFGVALDSRPNYTKMDWLMWIATMTKDQGTFDKLVDPIWKFLNETPDRVPMTDWYRVDEARHVGFQARSVVSGLFMPMLAK